MPGRQVGAAALVAQDHVDRRARQIAVDEDHRQRLPEEIAKDVHAAPGGHVQEPVDLAPGEEVHVHPLPELLALRVAQDHAVVPAEGRRLDAPSELGEVRVRAVREHEAQRVGPAPPERAGDGVRMVAELRHGLHHARADLVGDEAGGVDDVRDRGRRHAGASGNLANGSHQSLLDETDGARSNRLRNRLGETSALTPDCVKWHEPGVGDMAVAPGRNPSGQKNVDAERDGADLRLGGRLTRSTLPSRSTHAVPLGRSPVRVGSPGPSVRSRARRRTAGERPQGERRLTTRIGSPAGWLGSGGSNTIEPAGEVEEPGGRPGSFEPRHSPARPGRRSAPAPGARAGRW